MTQQNVDDTANQQTSTKKKINRQLASCFLCRKRRTRCDRARPCSECSRRNVTCEYAHPAPIKLVEHQEREQYIKSLEEKLTALERSQTTATGTLEEPQDFTVDDLATQLSHFTLGRRIRSHPHPLQKQVESIISSVPPTTIIPSDHQFSLNLVLSYPIPSLGELCSEKFLPTKPQIDLFANHYFITKNVWAPSINSIDWTIQLESFWKASDRLQFRPSPTITPTDPNQQHRLAHFLSTIYSISAHGLLALADIHHLNPNSSSKQAPSPSNLPDDPSLRSLSQSEKIALANRWFRYALGLLISPVGNIYVKPTVFGIRAMSLLSNVEIAPENLDHGIFFWSLTTNLATSTGLLREPPISMDENIRDLDDVELESRRLLAWNILNLDWAGYAMSGGIRPYNDPDQFSVKIPGTVPSPSLPFHPIDGWPLDPIVCLRKVYALICRLRHQASIKILSGRPATYHDVLQIVEQFIQLEESLPPRFQVKLSADGKSLEPLVTSEQVHPLLVMFLCARFCAPRVSLHRLFIFPKKGVPPEERFRQLQMLLDVSKRHFLAIRQTPDYLNLHPLLIYTTVNTAVACALVLITNHQTPHLVIEEEFFLTELKKVIELFDLGKHTIATNMARKAFTLLQILVKKIELGGNSSGPDEISRARNKKGPGTTLRANQNHSTESVSDDYPRKLKQHIESRLGDRSRQSTSDLRQHSMGESSNGSSICSPASGHHSHSSPIALTSDHTSQSSLLDNHFGNQLPTSSSVLPQAKSRPGLTTSSTSTSIQSSNFLPDCVPDQFNNWWPLRQIVDLPSQRFGQNDLAEILEFGSINPKLTEHRFGLSHVTYNDNQLPVLNLNQGLDGQTSFGVVPACATLDHNDDNQGRPKQPTSNYQQAPPSTTSQNLNYPPGSFVNNEDTSNTHLFFDPSSTSVVDDHHPFFSL